MNKIRLLLLSIFFIIGIGLILNFSKFPDFISEPSPVSREIPTIENGTILLENELTILTRLDNSIFIANKSDRNMSYAIYPTFQTYLMEWYPCETDLACGDAIIEPDEVMKLNLEDHVDENGSTTVYWWIINRTGMAQNEGHFSSQLAL